MSGDPDDDLAAWVDDDRKHLAAVAEIERLLDEGHPVAPHIAAAVEALAADPRLRAADTIGEMRAKYGRD